MLNKLSLRFNQLKWKTSKNNKGKRYSFIRIRQFYYEIELNNIINL